MILSLQDAVKASFQTVLTELYGLNASSQPSIVIQYPPNRTLGDLAVTVAFELARTLHKSPKLIGKEIVEALGPIEGVTKFAATPNGYVNLYLDRPAFLIKALTEGSSLETTQADTDKIIVEHTAINPNKSAHIGHLRNAALGDTLARLLRFQGRTVEVQNYIDDTGVQVADVIVGFRELEQKTLLEIQKLADSSRFDYYCWDLYARVTEWYGGDASRLKFRSRTLQDLDQGGNENAEIANYIADRIVRCHLATMDRLNIEYDLLSWEGDILRLSFWARAFEILKEAGAIFHQTKGKQAGCWVMEIDDDDSDADSSEIKGASNAGPDEKLRAKVIVRSDGTVTYIGKDIAYQFWKFGLLGMDFRYRQYGRQRSGRLLWATGATKEPSEIMPPSFGQAGAVYNVIDTRQSYLQQLLRQALTAIQEPHAAKHSIHYSYEMVALSNRTARSLGYTGAEKADRPFVEVSGRKGLGVKADDLLDRVTEAAAKEVSTRNTDLSKADAEQLARIIAVAAVRYFMIKYSRGRVIAFDIDEALSFEGETGPYLQYAAVRATNILLKLKAREGIGEPALAAKLSSIPTTALHDQTAEGSDDATVLWSLVFEAARLDEVAKQAVRTLELSSLAKYAFGLAQTFNAFYHRCPVINEEREDVQIWRAAAVSYARQQLARALDLMGCEIPPRM